MKKAEHIHKFKRLKYKSGNVTFFCALPDCSKKINPSLALGKRSLCWRCGEPFIMDEYSLRLAKPHCQNCHKPKDSSIPVSIVNDKPPLSLAERLKRVNQLQQKESEGDI